MFSTTTPNTNPSTQMEIDVKPISNSANKQNFLNSPEKTSKLSAAAAHKLVTHYNNKFSIRIIFNGDTAFGQEKISLAQKEFLDKIAIYQDDKQKYFNFLQDFCFKGTSWRTVEEYNWYTELTDFLKIHSFKILQAIYPYTESNTQNNSMYRQFRKLSAPEVEQLNTVVKNLKCITQLNAIIEYYIRYLRTSATDLTLSAEDALKEISFIQASLNKAETVGYLFTSRHRYYEAHTEGFLITADKVIRLFLYDVHEREHKFYYTVPFYTGHMGDFISSANERKAPVFQVTLKECGPLALLMLKEHLKNQAEQFNHYTLSFPYYDETGELYFYFFHSPQVLRYSQSTLYFKIMAAQLEDRDSALVNHTYEGKNCQYQVITLKTVLTQSIAIAKTKDDDATVNANQTLLDQLPEFSKKWLAEYHKAITKRELMNKAGMMNHYLFYRADKMSKMSKSLRTTQEQKSCTTLKLV